MDLQLKDKVVFITGGTGAIGKEIVRCYIEEGAKVVFIYNRAEKKAVELIEQYGENNCSGFKASVLNRDRIENVSRQIFEKYDKIDILVNNSGITDVLPFPLIEEEDWDECMDTNVKGTFIATKEISRYMIKKRTGSIINIGSLAGERIMEVPVHYATSKAAISGFTLSLAKELSRYGIRVNCVVPGLIDGGVGRSVTEKQKNQYLEFCTSGRLGRSEEVANLVVYLSSPRASYINGQIIHIDGGI